MFKITYDPVIVSTPQAIGLAEPESFVIGGVEYTVLPDVTGKVQGGKDGQFFYLQSKGFAGRRFVIDAFDGRRIVTHNLWMGSDVDGPDTAQFVGAVAKPVSLAAEVRYSWEWR